MPPREEFFQTVLTLAERLENVSLACKLSGVSRSHFYRIKKFHHTVGPNRPALAKAPRPALSCHIPKELEYLILLMTERHPTIPYSGLAMRLKFDGISVPPALVQLVWRKHGLTRRAARVAWMGRLGAIRPLAGSGIEEMGSSCSVSPDGDHFLRNSHEEDV